MTLGSDLGPCLGDGLIVQANNVTINLNGHTVRGAGANPAGAIDQAGIHLKNVSGVTVRGPGTVREFFVGVLVEGGSNDTVTSVTATHNVGLGSTLYGDGIALEGANNSRVTANVVTGNGPNDGIHLDNGASYNSVDHNTVTDNTVVTPQGGPGGSDVQYDVGIQSDNGASFNNVDYNSVLRNGFFGIALAGFNVGYGRATHNTVRDNGAFGINAGGLHGHLIANNVIDHNGYEQFAPLGQPKNIGEFGGVVTCGFCFNKPPAGPSDITTIQDNNITRNAGQGVALAFNGNQAAGGCGIYGCFPPQPYVAPRSNLVQRNTVTGNGGDGIFVECDHLYDASFNSTCLASSPPHLGQRILNNGSVSNGGAGAGRTAWDLHDENPNCDHDVWSHNVYRTANPPCTTA